MLKIVWQRGFSRIIGVFVILSISDVLVGKASDDTENINEWQANSETTVEYILNANNSSYEFESNATTTSDRTSTEEEDQLWRTNLKPKIRIQPAQYVSPNIHSEVGSNDELSDYIEDYGDTAIESKRPAIVDDEAIENLLERLLNPILSEKPQFNEKIALLINSSTYWNDENIQPPMSIKDPQEAKKWIDGYSEEAQKILHEVALAHWEYLTSRTTFNERSMQEADDALSLFVRAVTKQVKQYDLVSLNDTMLRGQFEMLSYEGINALDDSLLTKYLNVSMKLNQKTRTTSVCLEGRCRMKLSQLNTMLSQTANSTRALNIWKTWRAAVSEGFSSLYSEFAHLLNEAAKKNGFEHAGAMWGGYGFEKSDMNRKESFDVITETRSIYENIAPFYKKLHAYVRWNLAALYGSNDATGITKDGPIPAHLLKSLTGQTWSAIYEDTKPFDERQLSHQITDALKHNNYTAKTMFIEAYRFFKSIGFEKLPSSFWRNSVFERSWSKDMLCDPPNAYDMRDGNDYRIRACLLPNLDEYKVAHKLLAQIYYQYTYRHQPISFQEPPSQIIFNAIANAFEIVSGNPENLARLGLLPTNFQKNQSVRINELYREALENFVQLPFDLASDAWHYKILSGELSINNSNREWWRLSELYTGVVRTAAEEPTDFDVAVIPSISQIQWSTNHHFLTHIVQFQILKSICANDPLLSDGCTVNREKIAVMKDIMAQGSSINWNQALKILTGTEKLDARPLLEYYDPLIVWLANTVENNELYAGWDGNGTSFNKSEIPQWSRNNSNSHITQMSIDKLAYPGQSCSNGEECLLDSECKDEKCECKEGFYTLKIAGTHSCLTSNPADAGFGTINSSLLIGLYPQDDNYTDMSSPTPTQIDNEITRSDPAETLDSTNKPNSAVRFDRKLSIILTLCAIKFCLF